MRFLIHYSFPMAISEAQHRNLPAELGTVVLSCDESVGQTESSAAVSLISEALFNVFDCDQIAVNSISLWGRAESMSEDLIRSGSRASVVKVGRTEIVCGVCSEPKILKAAIEVIWPNAEALVCYRADSSEPNLGVLDQVGKRRSGYEAAYATALDSHEILAFMESGRLSVEFIGTGPRLWIALNGIRSLLGRTVSVAN